MSRNPFLSTFEAEFNKEAKKTDVDMSASMRPSPKKTSFGTSAAEELFVRLPPRLPSRLVFRLPALTRHTRHTRPWRVASCPRRRKQKPLPCSPCLSTLIRYHGLLSPFCGSVR
jgi:hypothetical protein